MRFDGFPLCFFGTKPVELFVGFFEIGRLWRERNAVGENVNYCENKRTAFYQTDIFKP